MKAGCLSAVRGERGESTAQGIAEGQALKREWLPALKDSGKTCELLTFPDVGHRFFEAVWESAMQQSMAFFQTHLKPTPAIAPR